MTYHLTYPKKSDVVRVGKWRNDARVGLRTSGFTLPSQQEAFYDSMLKHTIPGAPAATARYFSVRDEDSQCVAFVGLNPIQWENQLGEISLVTDPNKTGRGIGMASVDLILDEGFGRLGLQTIYGEVYTVNPAVRFWDKVCVKYSAHTAVLPRRKMWDGVLHDSIWFTITAGSWQAVQGEVSAG